MAKLKLFDNFRFRLLLLSFLTGASGGLIAILYRLALEFIEHQRMNTISRTQFSNNWTWPALWLVLGIVASHIIAMFVKHEPLISGSGIPQVKAYLVGQVRQWPLIGLVYKFTGGAMAIFNGLSLGREGPSIQLGSLAGQFLGEQFGKTELERKTLVSAGASVGLAAAFNAPLAGVLFAVEELYKNFSPLIILACTLSSVTGTLLANIIMGFEPVFPISVTTAFPFQNYWHLIVLGALVSVAAHWFNRLLIFFSSVMKKLDFNKVLFATLISIVFMLFFPLVNGGGHRIIETLLFDRHTLLFLSVLFICKYLFTFVSYGTQSPGGIFLPLLSLGAILGALYCDITVGVSAYTFDYREAYILFGMVAMFTAVVKAPVTGIVLLVEMSRSVSSMLPLAVVAFSAYLMSEILKTEPVYETLLRNLLASRTMQPESHPAMQNSSASRQRGKTTTCTRTMLEVILPQGSIWNGKTLGELPLPPDTIIASLISGEEEYAPQKDTIVYEGDLLIVVVNAESSHKVLELFAQMHK